MGESDAKLPPGTPESPHAQQLRRGFPRLRFDPPLEQEFRQVHQAEARPQIRRNLWLAIAFVAGFSALTHMVLDAGISRVLDVIRLVMLAPILVIALAVVHSRLYQRWWPITCALGAPVFGIGVVVLAVMAALHGVNLIASVVLAIIYIFVMMGMRFYTALGAALAVFVCYLIAAAVAGLPAPAVVVDVGVLVFTIVIGALVCHSLERTTRTNFLEERMLIETASRDGLTGIHNRRIFDEHVDRLWTQATRERSSLGLLLIDIDHFKAYNDCYGHQAGDECLRQVAACLSRCARRPLDISARYGGEEFAVVLHDAGRSHVEDAARRIQAGIEALGIAHSAAPASNGRLTVSIGAACVQAAAGRSQFGFIQLADEALYAAKKGGRNRVVIRDKEYGELRTGSFRNSATDAPARDEDVSATT